MKRMKTLMTALLVLALMLPGLMTAEAVPTVGILQYVQHAALDAARDGFVKGLEEEGFVDQKNSEHHLPERPGGPEHLRLHRRPVCGGQGGFDAGHRHPGGAGPGRQDGQHPHPGHRGD